jgi:hypothetical protein
LSPELIETFPILGTSARCSGQIGALTACAAEEVADQAVDVPSGVAGSWHTVGGKRVEPDLVDGRMAMVARQSSIA